MAKRRTGRPRKIDDQELRERILRAIEQGATDRTAAAAGGVGYSTLAAWLARGRDSHAGAIYVEFWEAVQRARARRPEAVLRYIADHEDWRARARYLEFLHTIEDRASTADARRRKLEAEVTKVELANELLRVRVELAKAQVDAVRDPDRPTQLMVVGVDHVLDHPDAPVELKELLERFLWRQEAVLFRRRDLCGGADASG
ncbi:MAG: hypothetical protein ABIL09_11025 [Gemmatimonadota bacterium]